ncbi:MAG: DUF4132 domain-containing protein [Bacteroidia bacterium]|nr:DUF4132 domain-containing protein [Bacteroidia bacterium]
MGIFDKIKKALGIESANSSPKPTEAAKGKGGIQESQKIVDEFDEILNQALAQAKGSKAYIYDAKATEWDVYQNLVKNWDDKKRIAFIVDCCKKIHAFAIQERKYVYDHPEQHLKELRLIFIKQLLKTKLMMDDDDVVLLVKTFRESKYHLHSGINHWPINQLVNQVASQRKGNPISESLRNTMEQLITDIKAVNSYYDEKERIKLAEKIDALLFPDSEGIPSVKPTKFLGDDEFATFANQKITELTPAERNHWYPMITLAQTASGSKPSTKYLEASKTLFKALGPDKFKITLIEWLQFVIRFKEKITQHTQIYQGREYHSTSYEFITSVNLEALKGFVWMCANFHDTQTLHTVAQLAERCYRKIPSKGPAAASLGNACLFVLYKSKGLEGISHLSRLKLRIKQASTQALIEKYLTDAAKSAGISVAEIEDLAVDDFGFKNGKRRWEFDGFVFELEIISPGKLKQQWYKPDGTLQKSEPTAVKTNHLAKLKKMKLVVKQVEQASTAQRDRIDRMLRSDRKLKSSYFQQYYLQHGFMSFLTKKLIWNFHNREEIVAAIWFEDGWVNAKGQTIHIDENAEVSLWHPALSSVAEIKIWREFLIEHQILQPLKQGFREVYLLTEAEINTRTYSNRMAAHVLKQHQFNSLAKGRGWKYALLGAYDDGREGELATLALPEFGLRVEYWVTGVNADDAFNDTGIWNYIATDQVRFVSTTTEQPVELIAVPPIPFSEAMRDVDLFVGVASVGNDPTWQDSGGIPAYRDYWQTYSFGDLNEVAKMRKEILAGLIPRLKVKNVAQIVGNFLVVKGKLRTYKIHIGSTNILMEPNDQYLCIVPDRSAKTGTENIFLPFEGDSGLSVVLSKAFLLAEDDKITDGSITSQINRK